MQSLCDPVFARQPLAAPRAAAGELALWLLRLSWLMLAGAAAGGCFGRESPSLKSNDPSRKIPAIKLAVERHDQSAIAPMIAALASDDPAIRFYAIQGLQRLTGQTFGYRFYDPEPQRNAAIDRWNAWLQAGRPPAMQPADPPGGQIPTTSPARRDTLPSRSAPLSAAPGGGRNA